MGAAQLVPQPPPRPTIAMATDCVLAATLRDVNAAFGSDSEYITCDRLENDLCERFRMFHQGSVSLFRPCIIEPRECDEDETECLEMGGMYCVPGDILFCECLAHNVDCPSAPPVPPSLPPPSPPCSPSPPLRPPPPPVPTPPAPPAPPGRPPWPPLPPRLPPLAGPIRLTAAGTRLVDSYGRSVVLQGVNMYLEWYRNYYGDVGGGSSALDIPHLRRALPAANCIRFVALLWKDSVKASDGLECSSNDASRGYLREDCVRYIDALVQQATDAGLWVILTARAKYAAGWSGPDVWHDHTMRRQMLAMWEFVAARYRGVGRIAGYEIMSEPRTKTVPQSKVRDFMREGCEAVHRADPAALCVVGPAPCNHAVELGPVAVPARGHSARYWLRFPCASRSFPHRPRARALLLWTDYKLWEMSSQVLQPSGSNTLYTFDFFVPKHFVM